MDAVTRRHLLRGVGATVVAGALAGCSGNGNDAGNGDDVPDNGDPLTAHLSDARGYGGQLQDLTGESEVVVENGAGNEGFAFDPAGIRIDAGTTVVWEWTGRGGGHNVSSTGESDFSFQSEITRDADHTFDYTFEETGVALYVCDPHRGQRMKGGIEVV